MLENDRTTRDSQCQQFPLSPPVEFLESHAEPSSGKLDAFEHRHELSSEPSLPLRAKTTVVTSHHKIYCRIPPASVQIRGRGGFVFSCVTTFHCALSHCLSALNTKMMQLITAIPYSYRCCSLLHPRRMYPQGNNKRSYNATKLIISAASRSDAYGNDREYHGKSVDESMVVLRKKIHEVKITEANCETPDEWMEWEKRYYCERYASDVCEAVGVLQSLLINARPSFALGMAAIIALSIPLSAGVIIFRLVEVTMWLAAGIRL